MKNPRHPKDPHNGSRLDLVFKHKSHVNACDILSEEASYFKNQNQNGSRFYFSFPFHWIWLNCRFSLTFSTTWVLQFTAVRVFKSHCGLVTHCLHCFFKCFWAIESKRFQAHCGFTIAKLLLNLKSFFFWWKLKKKKSPELRRLIDW